MSSNINSSHVSPSCKAVISYRGEKIELNLEEGLTVEELQAAVVSQARAAQEAQVQPTDVKLMFKGKILKRDGGDTPADAMQLLQKIAGGKALKVYKLVATGVSQTEAEMLQADMAHGMQDTARLVRDDLTAQGQREMERRKRLGRQMLQQKASSSQNKATTTMSSSYRFGTIETLPNLPNREKAKQILETLANDPGILACMAKHKFTVGTLAEMYPEGKVGESEVCVMGLNQNAGQKILLRIRTDDLTGFRKMLSIRKVLFHELAHNVHSEHNGEFFQLMRQIERDCNELDWTQGAGLSSSLSGENEMSVFEGGTYRLGGNDGKDSSTAATAAPSTITVRELAARAALLRMTAEKEEIEENCGCTSHGESNNKKKQKKADLFLPPSEKYQKQADK